MNTNELNHLEKLIQKKLSTLKEDDQENILLTKSVLKFILSLVDEKIEKNSNSLIASQEDIDNLSCD